MTHCVACWEGSSSADSINLTPGIHSGQNHNPAIWLVKQLLKNPSQNLMSFQTKITNLLLPDAFNKRLAAAEQLQDGMPDVWLLARMKKNCVMNLASCKQNAAKTATALEDLAMQLDDIGANKSTAAAAAAAAFSAEGPEDTGGGDVFIDEDAGNNSQQF